MTLFLRVMSDCHCYYYCYCYWEIFYHAIEALYTNTVDELELTPFLCARTKNVAKPRLKKFSVVLALLKRLTDHCFSLLTNVTQLFDHLLAVTSLLFSYYLIITSPWQKVPNGDGTRFTMCDS